MCACALCFCMRLRLRLPLAIAAAHVRQGTRPHANSNCQMPDGRTQESHARRVLPRAGNSILWNSKTDMGCFESGIATVSPSRSRSRSHTRSRARTGARTNSNLPATPLRAFSHGHDATTASVYSWKIHRRQHRRKSGQPDRQSDSRTIGETYRRLGPRRPKQCSRAWPIRWLHPTTSCRRGEQLTRSRTILRGFQCRKVPADHNRTGTGQAGTRLDRSGEHRGEKGKRKRR